MAEEGVNFETLMAYKIEDEMQKISQLMAQEGYTKDRESSIAFRHQDWSPIMGCRRIGGRNLPLTKGFKWHGQPYPDASEASWSACTVLSRMPGLQAALDSGDTTALDLPNEASGHIRVGIRSPACKELHEMGWVNVPQALLDPHTQAKFQVYSSDPSVPASPRQQQQQQLPAMRFGDMMAALGFKHRLDEVKLLQDLPWLYGLKFVMGTSVALVIKTARAAEEHIKKYLPVVENMRNLELFGAPWPALASVPAAPVLGGHAANSSGSSLEARNLQPTKHTRMTPAVPAGYQPLSDVQNVLPSAAVINSMQTVVAAAPNFFPQVAPPLLPPPPPCPLFLPPKLAAAMPEHVGVPMTGIGAHAPEAAAAAMHQLLSSAPQVPGMLSVQRVHQTGIQPPTLTGAGPAGMLSNHYYYTGKTGPQGSHKPAGAEQALLHGSGRHSLSALGLHASTVTHAHAAAAHAAAHPQNRLFNGLVVGRQVQEGLQASIGMLVLPEPDLQTDSTLTPLSELQAVQGMGTLLSSLGHPNAVQQFRNLYHQVYSSTLESRRYLASAYLDLRKAQSQNDMQYARRVFTELLHLQL